MIDLGLGILEEFVAREWARRPDLQGLRVFTRSPREPAPPPPTRSPCPLCGRIPAHHARLGCAVLGVMPPVLPRTRGLASYERRAAP
jgi:hypothetical protein